MMGSFLSTGRMGVCIECNRFRQSPASVDKAHAGNRKLRPPNSTSRPRFGTHLSARADVRAEVRHYHERVEPRRREPPVPGAFVSIATSRLPNGSEPVAKCVPRQVRDDGEGHGSEGPAPHAAPARCLRAPAIPSIGPAMPPRSRKSLGLPSREQIVEFIQTSDRPAGKREIAKAFGLKGEQRIALKRLLKDMAEEGLIDGKKTAFHRMGGVPKVTVLRVVDVDEGEAIAIPDAWQPDDGAPPPRLRLVESKRHAALKVGDRVLARTEETGRGWTAHPMKKLPARGEGLLGVVELDGSGKAWLAPTDKRVRNSSPIADLGGAEPGQLVLAEPGRTPRSGVKVVEVLGDPLAPKAFSLIAIHKYDIPHVFGEQTLAEAELAAKLPVGEEHREDLRHLPIVAIDPADARDHDDAIWAEPDGEGGFRAIVAIADVSFYVRPGGQIDKEARRRGNSVYFPDRVVPMLPEVLSADVCSLKQGEDRAAMACHLRIDSRGRVKDWRFTRALVRIAEVVAYEDAQARIDSLEPSPLQGRGLGEGDVTESADIPRPPTPSP